MARKKRSPKQRIADTKRLIAESHGLLRTTGELCEELKRRKWKLRESRAASRSVSRRLNPNLPAPRRRRVA